MAVVVWHPRGEQFVAEIAQSVSAGQTQEGEDTSRTLAHDSDTLTVGRSVDAIVHK